MSGGKSSWISETRDGLVFRIYVQPKASRTEVVGIHGEGATARLKIRVAAPPVDGAANEELLRFLKKATRATSVSLLRGESSRNKDVLVQGVSKEAAGSVLNP